MGPNSCYAFWLAGIEIETTLVEIRVSGCMIDELGKKRRLMNVDSSADSRSVLANSWPKASIARTFEAIALILSHKARSVLFATTSASYNFSSDGNVVGGTEARLPFPRKLPPQSLTGVSALGHEASRTATSYKKKLLRTAGGFTSRLTLLDGIAIIT